MTFSALVLAGGKATRFGGIAKHEIVVDGETIFARQCRALASAEEILVSGRDIEGHRSVLDTIEGAGPLAGIAAGLAVCGTAWLLVVAGDMPYITHTLVRRLVSATGPDVDAVGVRSANGLPEPLLCVLNVQTRPVIERALEAGRYKASRILTDEGLRVRWLDADPEALRNINSPEDLREATGSK